MVSARFLACRAKCCLRLARRLAEPSLCTGLATTRLANLLRVRGRATAQAAGGDLIGASPEGRLSRNPLHLRDASLHLTRVTNREDST